MDFWSILHFYSLYCSNNLLQLQLKVRCTYSIIVLDVISQTDTLERPSCFFLFCEENKFCAYCYLIIGFIMQCVVEFIQM